MIQNIILHCISNVLPVKSILGGKICCSVSGRKNGWVCEKKKSQVTDKQPWHGKEKTKVLYYEAGEISEYD